MSKWHVIARIYGYIICLVVLLVGLFRLGVFVEALFDLGDPLHVEGFYGGRDLSSFEAYKLEVLKSAGEGQQAGVGVSPAGGERKEAERYVPDEKAIRAMYDAEKADRIHTGLRKTHRALAMNGALVLVCMAVFATHWRWLRRLPMPEA
jgi:hypothetical protein